MYVASWLPTCMVVIVNKNGRRNTKKKRKEIGKRSNVCDLILRGAEHTKAKMEYVCLVSSMEEKIKDKVK